MLSSRIKEILQNHRRIGIFVSGGIDSTLILYLCYLLKREENEFLLFTVPRPNNSLHFSKQVLKWIDKKFLTTSKTHIVGTSDVHHSKQVLSGIITALQFPIDVIVLGDTRNPAELPGGPNRGLSTNLRVLQPFIDVTKDEIIKEIVNLGVQEIIDITGTCARGLSPECRECWPCQEKLWALAKNNLAPPAGIEPTSTG